MPAVRSTGGSGLVNITPPVEDVMRELRAGPDRLDLGVRKRFRKLALDVRDDARAKARTRRHMSQGPADGAPARVRLSLAQHWADLEKSITSGATSKSPTVQIGSERVPWAMGTEFGSSRFRQFPAWSGNGRDAGFILFPTVRGATKTVEKGMIDALNEAYAAAFPD